MAYTNAKHFTLIIAGDNPEELIKQYDKGLEIGKTTVYRFKDAKKLHEQYIKCYEITLANIDKSMKDEIKSCKKRLKEIKAMDDIAFYAELTMGYDIDDETGDAYTTENVFGKYDSCKLGKDLSVPLIDKDGNETFSELKKNIDWSKIHMNNRYTYEVVWDMCMDGREPENDEEKALYENMKNRKAYFEYYGDKESYVVSNVAFSGSAFLSEETGWVEIAENESLPKWIAKFYDKYIDRLSDDTRISVYEVTRYE